MPEDSFITCRNSQGLEFRGVLLRLKRHSIVFEVYNPYSILQLSEVLVDCKIYVKGQLTYTGRVVVSNLVNTGVLLVCEATLAEEWLNIDIFASLHEKDRLKKEFSEFIEEWEKTFQVQPEFKIVVSDMQTLLVDLRQWLEQVELAVRSDPSIDQQKREREILEELKQPIFSTIENLFHRFEDITKPIDSEVQPVHRAYLRRQLHPLVLCSPFLHRTFTKPLGYAGDYEMVNMMLRNPFEGSSLFAKMANFFFLSLSPPTAHRNRIQYLLQKLNEETLRVTRQGKTVKVFNLGCGPAQEIQGFLLQNDLCDRVEFTLLDFNEETLQHVRTRLGEIKTKQNRKTSIEPFQRSVHQILKQTLKNNDSLFSHNTYDLVYCAGLFDYLSDRICKRLMDIFYSILAPGGLLIATNVHPSNPQINAMEYLMEWHLIYRDEQKMAQLKPDLGLAKDYKLLRDPTGVNIFLELRKSNDA